MQELTINTDRFDRSNTFLVAYQGRKGEQTIKARLCNFDDEGLIALSSNAVIKSSYSKDEVAERERLNASTPIRNGDTVLIEGKQYKVRVTGPFSDCAYFTAV